MKLPEAHARHLFVTGFGAFGDVTFNPSGAIAACLQDAPPAGWSVSSVQLPVTFQGAPLGIERGLAEQTRVPSLLLGIGVHPGRTFRLERRARSQLFNTRVDTEGKTAAATDEHTSRHHADDHVARHSEHRVARERITTLDLRRLALALSVTGAGAVTVSNDAGQYVCERAYHQLLALAEAQAVNALFLHVPPVHAVPLPEQVSMVRQWLASCATLLG